MTPNWNSPPPVFSGVRVTRSLVLCMFCRSLSFCTFFVGHCVVCSSSIYGFWLPLWYPQTLLTYNLLWQSHISLTLFKMGMELSWQNVMYIQLIGIQCRFYTAYYNCRNIFGCIAIYLIYIQGIFPFRYGWIVRWLFVLGVNCSCEGNDVPRIWHSNSYFYTQWYHQGRFSSRISNFSKENPINHDYFKINLNYLIMWQWQECQLF